jgi:hypothetical protein
VGLRHLDRGQRAARAVGLRGSRGRSQSLPQPLRVSCCWPTLAAANLGVGRQRAWPPNTDAITDATGNPDRPRKGAMLPHIAYQRAASPRAPPWSRRGGGGTVKECTIAASGLGRRCWRHWYGPPSSTPASVATPEALAMAAPASTPDAPGPLSRGLDAARGASKRPCDVASPTWPARRLREFEQVANPGARRLGSRPSRPACGPWSATARAAEDPVTAESKIECLARNPGPAPSWPAGATLGVRRVAAAGDGRRRVDARRADCAPPQQHVHRKCRRTGFAERARRELNGAGEQSCGRRAGRTPAASSHRMAEQIARLRADGGGPTRRSPAELLQSAHAAVGVAPAPMSSPNARVTRPRRWPRGSRSHVAGGDSSAGVTRVKGPSNADSGDRRPLGMRPCASVCGHDPPGHHSRCGASSGGRRTAGGRTSPRPRW